MHFFEYGTYRNVNSAGIFRDDYSQNKKVIWTTPALGRNSSAEKNGVTLLPDDKGRTEQASGNSPHMTSSDITKKDTTKSVPANMHVCKSIE